MKYALVTGCDHGVGLALAEQLVQRDYIVATCRFSEDEPQLASLARLHPGKMTIIPLDISSEESVTHLASAFPFPALDLLINNAGILGTMDDGPDAPLDFSLMQKVMSVNAFGALRVTTTLLPMLRRGTDKIVVNISSEAGSIGNCERTGWFGYCMSKAANNMQGALIHNTLRREGGCVFQIHPGHVATYMRGHLDTTARITPAESAEGILRVVLDTPHETRERPLYLDYQGKELPW